MSGLSSAQATVQLLHILHIFAVTTGYSYLTLQHFVNYFARNGMEHHDLLDRAVAFLQDNFLDRPTLRDGADLIGMSETAFSRFFMWRTGNTFTEHLVSLRIGCAQQLLAGSEETITDVCFLSGFRNISNFNRTFLKRVGMAPSAYRKAVRLRR